MAVEVHTVVLALGKNPMGWSLGLADWSTWRICVVVHVFVVQSFGEEELGGLKSSGRRQDGPGPGAASVMEVMVAGQVNIKVLQGSTEMQE